jgi:ATP-dependent DNA helicase RecG
LPKSIFTPSQTVKLRKLKITSVFDLLLHLPTRYQNETKIESIESIVPGTPVQIEGVITQSTVNYGPRKNLIVIIADSSDSIQLRFVNFYPSQINDLSEGKKIRVFGEVKKNLFLNEMIHPQYKLLKEDEPLPKTFSPIYPTTSGLSQKLLCKLIKKSIGKSLEAKVYNDYFPELYSKRKLPLLMDAIEEIHFPSKDTDIELFNQKDNAYHHRLIYDEFLAQQLFLRGLYHQKKLHLSMPIKFSDELHQAFIKNLEFKLTETQEAVVQDIYNDIENNHPMNRLLQGDVGSGKTVVAVMTAIQVIGSGYQVAFMAPTEILAEQHFSKIKEWLGPFGFSVDLLRGSMSPSNKKIAQKKITNGETEIVVGTHALFQEEVIFKNLAFYIIDEQHRFGVEQRIQLRKNNLINQKFEAHQLMMSATPIPRTLSMSYFSDMDISVINKLPPGRQTITTKLFSEERREDILETINQEVINGSQVYWVCPLIEESETLQLETAENTYSILHKYFDEHQVGLIHGRMKSSEKESVMEKFKDKEIKILVATTVIEVGVDVPNATLMIIENAERMGLSQLHQLRGRVGRGAKKSVCIMLYQKKLSILAKQRLKIIYDHIDGFKIAEEDLKIRGPGEFLGLKQSGVPMFRVADIQRDSALLELAKQDADHLIESEHPSINLHLERWLRNYQEIIRA